ncbi:MAG: DUF333 domain-containing protein [Patescibacteria group bacterium]
MTNLKEKNKTIYKNKLIWLFFLIIIALAVYFAFANKKNNPPTNINNDLININNDALNNPAPETISAKFLCQDNKFINATFNNQGNGSVDLLLSDDRKITLPRAMSASGARYASNDEGFVFWNKGETAFIEENGQTTFNDCLTASDRQTEENNVGIANPASSNCIKLGGTLEMRSNAKGQYGVCLFLDNRQCEEWALLRGQCPVGGRKITGYENEAQIYCAITGGEVEGLGTDSVLCKRVDGTYCQVDSNFDGDCPDPNDPNPNSGNMEAN